MPTNNLQKGSWKVKMQNGVLRYATGPHTGKVVGSIRGSKSSPVSAPAVKVIPLPSKLNSISYQSKLTPQEREALEEYQSGVINSENGGYTAIQSYLRTGKPKYSVSHFDENLAKNHVEKLDSAIHKSTIIKPLTVFRGLTLQGEAQINEFLENVKTNQRLTDDGYASTSVDRKIAGAFTERLNPGSLSVMLKIDLKPGDKALYLNDFSYPSKEKEVLLPRNAVFKVKNISSSGVMKIITLEVESNEKT